MSDNKLLCAWCMKPVDDGVDLWYETMSSCDSCGNPGMAKIEISCTNPKCSMYGKVIYAK